MNVVVGSWGTAEGEIGKHVKFNKVHFSLCSKRQISLTSTKGWVRFGHSESISVELMSLSIYSET